MNFSSAIDISSRGSIRPLKGLVRVITLVGFVWLCLVGMVESTKTTLISTKHNIKHQVDQEVMVGRGKLVAHPKMNINYMSKRRVPNGPDPIHNRRSGNSRRPPGQA